jgi:hypothetical protein
MKGGLGHLVIAVILILLGVIWMGNEAGWWAAINIPFWPAVIVLIGLAMLFGYIEKRK